MFLKTDANSALYQQIYGHLRQAILSGEMRAGSRLPSSRVLARDSGVSRNTVLLAFDQLLAEGYICARIGSGTFVAAELPDAKFTRAAVQGARQSAATASTRLSSYAQRVLDAATSRPPAYDPSLRYDFRYGLPGVQDFPFFVWRNLLMRRLRRPQLSSLTYGPPEGLATLRETLATYLRRARAVECTPEQIVIVNGSQQALDLVARVMLDPGDTVVIEEPHYVGARQTFAAVGAKIVGVPVGAEGLDVDRAPRAARGARLAYVTPSHQFPTGVVMPLSRRLALLEWAQSTDTYVVEDDYDSEYRFGGRPVEAVQALDRNQRVIYIGTLSKTLFPALRIGYLVLPQRLVPSFTAAKFLADRHTPTLPQEVLADFIGEGHFERHIRRTRTRNAARREALLHAINEFLSDEVVIEGSSAGLHMLLWMNNVSAAALDGIVARAGKASVGVYPVTPCYLKPPRRAGLLLGYAALEEAEIRRGIAKFAACLRGDGINPRGRRKHG